MVKSRFETSFLQSSSEILRAIAHPIRIAIVDILKRNGKLSVTGIHENLGIEQAIASHHLRILKDKQVLGSSREGKNTFYFLKSEQYSEIIATLEAVLT